MDNEKSGQRWIEPITTEDVLRQIDEANRRAEEAEIDLEFDWGGDGSNLHETVRVHVEAALVPTDVPYPPPLDELLRLGDARTRIDWDERLGSIGLTQAHVPELIRMTRDRGLNLAMGDTDEVWAPIHALRALKQFDVTPFVAELIPLLDLDIDWFSIDLPEVLRNSGGTGLEELGGYLHDHGRWILGRSVAAEAIAKIADQQPDLRERAVRMLSDELAHAALNDPTVNGSLLSELIELEAVEALPVIRRAFERNVVDEMIAGDWSQVLVALGQAPDPADPLVAQSQARWNAAQAATRLPFVDALDVLRDMPRPAQPKKSSRSTQKTKRKMAANSRKTNRKKQRK